MSLLTQAMENAHVLNKIRQDDGYGSGQVVWQVGMRLKAAFVLDSSVQARIAEKQGVTGMYTITTSRNTELDYHDVIRRESDGKIFRVTSNSDDKRAPKSTRLDMRVYQAEEWELTDNG